MTETPVDREALREQVLAVVEEHISDCLDDPAGRDVDTESEVLTDSLLAGPLAGVTERRLHQPVVAPAHGGWGVFCDACSRAAQDYVYPCAEGVEFPPERLVAVGDLVALRAEVERLRAALAIALSHLDDPRCAEVRAALNTPEGEQ